jgi:hypothetical protein
VILSEILLSIFNIFALKKKGYNFSHKKYIEFRISALFLATFRLISAISLFFYPREVEFMLRGPYADPRIFMFLLIYGFGRRRIDTEQETLIGTRIGRMLFYNFGCVINRKTASLSRVFIRHLGANTSNLDYHEGPLNSTSRFPHRTGADRAEEKVNAARARTVRFM